MTVEADLSRTVAERLTAARLRIRGREPFVGTLMLFAEWVPARDIDTAATDGRRILYNPGYIASLGRQQLDGLLAHEVLHLALRHVGRREQREPMLWNVAADIVTNGILLERRFSLPAGALVDDELARLSVEEAYAVLQQRGEPPHMVLDLIEPAAGDLGEEDAGAQWKLAVDRALALSRMADDQWGDMPAGLQREVGRLSAPQVDWRHQLWRYVVRTPTDFSGYDRRLVHRGLYLEELSHDTLNVSIAVDTSGSVHRSLLTQFMSEVRAICSLYRHVNVSLYFADAALYGPYSLADMTELPVATGGGGTAFEPFFEALSERYSTHLSPNVAVYLTDGFGSFPSQPPPAPVVWVVPPGGLASRKFPFGTVIRMVS